jgi:dTDP-3,4-didehydro-2,6-dideoxy-alpha-D-glucose 3-reductase
MDILVIGVSNIFRRKVLPALLDIDSVGLIHTASRRPSLNIEIPTHKRGSFFHGYETALRELSPCLAYISLPNSLHAEWTAKALEAGFHVIIDKPAFMNIEDTNNILDIADKKILCLAEATVWPFHPQIETVKKIFSDAQSEVVSIQSVFSFPPLPENNFRNFKSLGGGSFYDLGAYAVSPGRIFFDDKPNEVWCRKLCVNPEAEVDTGFAINAVYSNGRIMQGFFSFGTEYKNSLSLLGKNMSITIDNVFTVNKDFQVEINFRTKNETKSIKIPSSDIFNNFFSKVIESINDNNYSNWKEDLKLDAEVLNMAILSIEGK